MLTALSQGLRVIASTADKAQDFRCPDGHCGARVILKRGTRRIAHFAHQPGSACHLARETMAHMIAKLDIAGEYRSRGQDADVEVPVMSPVENRRADVLVVSPRSARIRYAIEVQDAAVGETELWQRTRSYAAASVRPVWIALLRRDSWHPKPDASGRLVVAKFAPRLHERWIEHVAGELWLYDPHAKEFWRTTFEDHLLWRGGTDYIDVGLGEHIQIPPYQVKSGRWVDAVVSGPWKLNQIRISANGRRPIGTLMGSDREISG